MSVAIGEPVAAARPVTLAADRDEPRGQQPFAVDLCRQHHLAREEHERRIEFAAGDALDEHAAPRGRDLRRERGPLRGQFGYQRGQHQFAEALREPDPELAGGRLLAGRQLAQRIDFAQDRATLLEDLPADVGRARGLRVAIEQGHAERFLEILDAPRDRGLRHPELGRGLAQGLAADHRCKSVDIANFHVCSAWSFRCIMTIHHIRHHIRGASR